MRKIIILDASGKGKVHVIKGAKYALEQEDVVEKWCERNQVGLSEIQWMTWDGVINIE